MPPQAILQTLCRCGHPAAMTTEGNVFCTHTGFDTWLCPEMVQSMRRERARARHRAKEQGKRGPYRDPDNPFMDEVQSRKNVYLWRQQCQQLMG